VRLAEAPSFGKPILLYDVTSVGAQAYMAVANELIERTRLVATGGAAVGAPAGKGARADVRAETPAVAVGGR
jgi:chromosome partitioning protein